MWDANSTLADPDKQTFIAKWHLHDLQHSYKSAISFNISARGHHIYFLLDTDLLHASLQDCIIVNFHSSLLGNDCNLLTDYVESAIFQDSTTNPTILGYCLLQISNLTQCQQYIKLVWNYSSQHKVGEQSNPVHTPCDRAML